MFSVSSIPQLTHYCFEICFVLDLLCFSLQSLPRPTSSCQPCPSGSVSTSSGATACDRCACGYSANSAHTSCTECAVGHYQSGEMPACAVCPGNSIAALPGACECTWDVERPGGRSSDDYRYVVLFCYFFMTTGDDCPFGTKAVRIYLFFVILQIQWISP